MVHKDNKKMLPENSNFKTKCCLLRHLKVTFSYFQNKNYEAVIRLITFAKEVKLSPVSICLFVGWLVSWFNSRIIQKL